MIRLCEKFETGVIFDVKVKVLFMSATPGDRTFSSANPAHRSRTNAAENAVVGG
jgi:hypothetical protein